MHYYITIPTWSQRVGPERVSFLAFGQHVDQLEGYEMGLLKSCHEDENDKPYQSDLLTHNSECRRER